MKKMLCLALALVLAIGLTAVAADNAPSVSNLKIQCPGGYKDCSDDDICYNGVCRIKWDTGGLRPSQWKVYLSTDGGKTYPYMLGTNAEISGDVATFSFEEPMWAGNPAQIKIIADNVDGKQYHATSKKFTLPSKRYAIDEPAPPNDPNAGETPMVIAQPVEDPKTGPVNPKTPIISPAERGEVGTDAIEPPTGEKDDGPGARTPGRKGTAELDAPAPPTGEKDNGPGAQTPGRKGTNELDAPVPPTDVKDDGPGAQTPDRRKGTNELDAPAPPKGVMDNRKGSNGSNSGHSVRVEYPNGGENVAVGSTQQIRWMSTPATDTYAVYLSTDGGKEYSQLNGRASSDQMSYSWEVTGNASKTAKVRVMALSALGLIMEDESDKTFEITSSSQPGGSK